MTPARLAAARVLIALDRGRTTLSAEVERERPDLADARDRGLFLELATGTTRWRAELDARLAVQSRRPLDELSAEVRAVLRLAAYQLFHLDRIPTHAIVHESVEVVRALGQERATGFVNGVLRNLVRGRKSPSGLPARPTDSSHEQQALDYLSVTLSHPRWLVERWLRRVGFEAAERWCQFNNAAPDTVVRPIDGPSDTLVGRLRAAGAGATAATFVPGAIRLAPGELGMLDPSTRAHLRVQDEASQLVAIAAGATSADLVLDACAAPGGKATMLSEAVGPRGRVIAGDVRPARVALLRELTARTRGVVQVVALDAEAGLPFGPAFDRVVLDAPCSGLGVLRRDPDIKWNRVPDDLRRFADSQHRMIRHAAGAVRPGGALLYATCSSEPEENDDVVQEFLGSTTEFRLARVEGLPERAMAAGVVDSRGFLRTLPWQHGLDAFFAALLVRRESA